MLASYVRNRLCGYAMVTALPSDVGQGDEVRFGQDAIRFHYMTVEMGQTLLFNKCL